MEIFIFLYSLLIIALALHLLDGLIKMILKEILLTKYATSRLTLAPLLYSL